MVNALSEWMEVQVRRDGYIWEQKYRRGKPAGALKRRRPCFFDGGYIETPIYDSQKLKAGNIISGPAIIEVPTTTAVIPRNFQCRVDEYNNYIITRRSP